MILAILAAGLGSRYGGLKQIDPISKNGEFIIDYSIYDAVKAGFDKIVFIIKEENYEIFKETIGSRVPSDIKVEYAFQTVNTLTEGFDISPERTKPWGTAHALLSAKEHLDDVFAVINADDFYGRGAFEVMASALPSLSGKNSVMIGYLLKNTLSENGTVARGICKVENGSVLEIQEHSKISRDKVTQEVLCHCTDTPHIVSENAFASMNFFGFSPDVLDDFVSGFKEFLGENAHSLKAEYYLPYAAGRFTDLKLYPTDEEWFGVTYREDRESTVKRIAHLIDIGIYPEKLFN